MINATLRRAVLAEVDALNALIAVSVRELSRDDYTPAQVEGALRGAFGVDTQLICDGSYFVIECDGRIAGCGGWSRRRTLFGSDNLLLYQRLGHQHTHDQMLSSAVTLRFMERRR